MDKIEFPETDQAVPPSFPSDQTLDLLAQRRSSSANLLEAPGLTDDQLRHLLQTASRVPDHRKLQPFRFLTFTDEARERFAELLLQAAKTNEKGSSLNEDSIRQQALRAPTMVVLISSVNPHHKTPVWEQELTAGAVGFSMLVTASAMGFAGQWLSEWMAFDDNVAKGLGLSEHERVAGFFYFGRGSSPPKERARPDLETIISAWTGPKA